MATTRLRRTFKYPSDADLDNEASDLDEQEQEDLITQLQTQSQSTDEIYIKIFSILPLACLPAFLFFMFRPQSTGTVRFICLLAMTSLMGSSLNMFMTPVGDDGKAKANGVLEVPGIGRVDSDGPLGRTLPLFNPIICGILAIAALGMRKKAGLGHEGVFEGFWMMCLLPGIIFGVVWFAKRSIREVEEGIGELGRMRYGYKGA